MATDTRLKLTAKEVRKLPLPANKDEVFYWDTDIPGFGVRLRRDRPSVFVFQYKIGTQHRRKTIGQVPTGEDITIPRKTAENLRSRVNLGEDVVATQRREIAKADETRRKDGTFEAIARDFLAWQKSRRRKNGRVGLSPRWLGQVEQHLTVYAKPLHKLQLASIARQDIAECIASTKNRGPTAGNALRSSLSSFFSWAIKNGKAGANPVIGSPREEQPSRNRVLTPDELRTIWRTLPKDHFGTIVKLLLLTGQRRSEIAGCTIQKFTTARLFFRAKERRMPWPMLFRYLIMPSTL